MAAACGQPAEKPAPAAAAPVERETSLANPLLWEISAGAGGATLVLLEKNDEVLRIACRRGEGMVVGGGRFKPVASEERMTVGAGDVTVTLVATPDAGRAPPAVKGEGPIDPDFISVVGEGRKIAANYGYQNMGPFEGPPPEMAAAFQAACGV